MQRTQFIDHQGVRILLVDFSGIRPGQEFDDSLQECKEIIHAQPEGSVLALFDATDGMFNNEVIESLKEFAKANTPYMKATALIGVKGLLKVALMTISRFSGREFKTFSTREEALAYLVGQ